MSENEMSQQERDAAVIAWMREHVEEHNILSESGVRYWSLARYTTPYQLELFTIAAIREIDRLRAENDTLRAACESVPEMLLNGAGALEDRAEIDRADELEAKAHALRAALASDARDGAGTAAGDATTGDGDGGIR